jgi:hypothetical protein
LIILLHSGCNPVHQEGDEGGIWPWSQGKETKPKKVKKIYTIRDVIKQQYQSRVNDEIPFKSTDKEYLGSYQRAVTAVLKNMDEEDLEEAEMILELWNKEGAPSDVQLK